ncbi:uncharacterized protein Z518_05651 [Rhinocladiella mackenziei CBS 650.93]|uniref:Uncharacterized protein n=1 Tax=Rhinocladiella mackenziei CBS 650.93 TaxID=1442369 RepID=A0A0D2J6T6_9EURO|nr:uncharacterized protein Z518_05651 [Rhinocladiella mackenziei CBS 650.93]KIX04780.1 hypothetical protein Z518_05651 [Rhinocladiella mackenziei CBS 650.93]
MSSIATTLGLHANGLTPVPCQAPYHAIFNFMFAYVFLSSRLLKNSYGIDHNVNPREDITRFGEKAVHDGKITRQQLNMLKRNEAAHANAMEHFPVFIGSTLFAIVSQVPNVTINRVCTIYSAARVVYAMAYLSVENVRFSYIRSLAWWISNFSCIYLLWKSGQALNAGMV